MNSYAVLSPEYPFEEVLDVVLAATAEQALQQAIKMFNGAHVVVEPLTTH